MCGIVGYIGHKSCEAILLEGLSKLEYRGYDSAGIAVQTADGLQLRKSKGRLSMLEQQLKGSALKGTAGIGHTRWATHGKPSDENSHPHADTTNQVVVVHNGIIENYITLREELEAEGVAFRSETDSEVIAHLVAKHDQGDLEQAVRRTIPLLKGAFAIAVICEREPDKMIAVRQASPLIVGLKDKESFLASDIPALLSHTRLVHILNDGEMAVLTSDGVQLSTVTGESIHREAMTVDWDAETAERGGYAHFMLKEIFEQPKAYKSTMGSRIDKDIARVSLKEVKITLQALRKVDRIHIVACGTAYHAGLLGKHVLETLLRIPVEVDIASEYRYREPIVTKHTLLIAVSQSGETADTLAAMREAKRQGARVIAISNAVGGSLAREADDVIMQWAGPEIAVASTKAYTTMLICFYLLGLHFAQMLQSADSKEIKQIIAALRELPLQAESLLERAEEMKTLAAKVADHPQMFFMGRGLDYAAAVEGSLKLKEISYIHSEAYAAGELKHGTLALIEDDIPVIALATQPQLFEKTVSNIIEVQARGAYVIGFTMDGMEIHQALGKSVDEVFTVPQTHPLLTPALTAIPLQLLAYYVSVMRGNDVDKPRNLAKSVTVE